MNSPAEMARAALALIYRADLKGSEVVEAHAAIQWLLSIADPPVVQTSAQEDETHAASPSSN